MPVKRCIRELDRLFVTPAESFDILYREMNIGSHSITHHCTYTNEWMPYFVDVVVFFCTLGKLEGELIDFKQALGVLYNDMQVVEPSRRQERDF